jgi:hypothetical protein
MGKTEKYRFLKNVAKVAGSTSRQFSIKKGEVFSGQDNDKGFIVFFKSPSNLQQGGRVAPLRVSISKSEIGSTIQRISYQESSIKPILPVRINQDVDSSKSDLNTEQTNDIEKDVIVEKSWWQKKSKSQKNTIIIGSIAVATFIGYLLYKRKI